jgi:protein SDA1
LNQRKIEEGPDIDMADGDDDQNGWEGWDIASDDSSEDESENGWINVESDGEEAFDMSDSEDESMKKKESLGPVVSQQSETSNQQEKRISTLATTKVRNRSQSLSTPFHSPRIVITDFNTSRFCLITRIAIE